MSRSPSSSYSRSRSRSRSRSPRGYRDDGETRDTVFAGNLNHDTNEDDLRRFFSEYGRVLETTIIYEQHTGRPKGFGFVRFEDQRDAEDAIADANGKILDGRPLKCNLARSSGRGFNSRGFRGGHRPPRFGDRVGSFAHSRRRRSQSPSPGRYLPDRYSPERSISPLHKRQRYSPPPPDRNAASQDPGRPRSSRQAGSPSGSSSYTTGSSYSTSDSEAKGHPVQPRDPPTIKVGVPEKIGLAAKAELQEAKQKESEASIRAAALEAEIEQHKVTRQEMQILLEDTAQRLQRSDLACKQYKKWLHALAGHSQAVVDGREGVQKAQAEVAQHEEALTLFLKECHEFLSSQEKPKRRHSRRHSKDIASNEAGKEAKPVVTADHKPDEAAQPNANEGLAEGVTAKFKPGIKFKLTA